MRQRGGFRGYSGRASRGEARCRVPDRALYGIILDRTRFLSADQKDRQKGVKRPEKCSYLADIGSLGTDVSI